MNNPNMYFKELGTVIFTVIRILSVTIYYTNFSRSCQFFRGDDRLKSQGAKIGAMKLFQSLRKTQYSPMKPFFDFFESTIIREKR